MNRSMNDEYDIKSLLEFYILSGVEDIADCEPIQLNAEAVKMPAERVIVGRSIADKKTEQPVRQATTELAQEMVMACKNAKDICAQVQTLDELRQAVENFEGCALKLTAANTVFGDGNVNAKIVLIGEAPGADEDRIGKPFVGRSGQLLDKMLAAIGLTRENYYITNILPWRPPGNRTPTSGEIAVCLPFLKKQLDIINPDYILLLGGSSANALFDNAEPISRLRGHWLEYKKSDGAIAKALATFHPAYLLRNTGQKSKAWADVLRLYAEIRG